MYTPQIMNHYENPQNVGTIENADGMAIVGAPANGEMIKLSIKILDGKIGDAQFKAFGCPTVIAVSSVATELIKGLHIEEALKVTSHHIENALGGLPSETQRYAIDAEKVFKSAIHDYLSNAKSQPGELP